MWRQWKTPRRRPGSTDGTGGARAVGEQHCWQRTRPLVSRKGQSSICWAFRHWSTSVRVTFSNRRVRTRTHGGVEGSAGDRRPYADRVALFENDEPPRRFLAVSARSPGLPKPSRPHDACSGIGQCQSELICESCSTVLLLTEVGQKAMLSELLGYLALPDPRQTEVGYEREPVIR